MSQMKHKMDEVAARMGIDDPNDERVKAEVTRQLFKHTCLGEERAYLEALKNMKALGGMFLGADIDEVIEKQEARVTRLEKLLAEQEVKPCQRR